MNKRFDLAFPDNPGYRFVRLCLGDGPGEESYLPCPFALTARMISLA